MVVSLQLGLPHANSLTYPILDEKYKESLKLIANTIRALTVDAVQQAGSGHPGTPMGCADLGAYLYGRFMRYSPKNPKWENRDRFILSAGHASMLIYSCFHFSGTSLTLEDLKRYRRLGSLTPSHPEYGLTPGVESTTGLDGQGIGHAVGQAIGLKLLQAKFNRKSCNLYDSKVIVLAGDGCFMEGVSHEVCSLAGHLNLDNLILIYDRNKTSLDGYVEESCSENTKLRFKAYDWDVYEINGHEFDDMEAVFQKLRAEQSKPALIIANTIIGKGAPTKAGSFYIHSEPLEQEERQATKKEMGFPETEFFVPRQVYEFFEERSKFNNSLEEQWLKIFNVWRRTHPELYQEYQKMNQEWLPTDFEEQLKNLRIPENISGRKASNLVIQFLGSQIPSLYGGSADLARSDMTYIQAYSSLKKGQFSGRNIKYGVREFGMVTIAVGLAQTQKIRPFIGTFLAFSDYMLSGIRLAALMKVQLILQLTHDSFFIGQDGPTHQPIEHLSHLRAMPGIHVIRPADEREVKMSWLAALKYQGPTAIILSRNDAPQCAGTDKPYSEGVGRGAYVVKKGKENLNYTLIATGSEVSLALGVSSALESLGYSVSVVSMPCWEIFDEQSEEYKNSIIGHNSGIRVSIEAASGIGWHKYTQGGPVICVENFGKSGLPTELAKEFGFTVEKIVQKILQCPQRARL